MSSSCGGCGMQNRGLKSSRGSWGAGESYWIASTCSGSSGKGGDGKWSALWNCVSLEWVHLHLYWLWQQPIVVEKGQSLV